MDGRLRSRASVSSALRRAPTRPTPSTSVHGVPALRRRRTRRPAWAGIALTLATFAAGPGAVPAAGAEVLDIRVTDVRIENYPDVELRVNPPKELSLLDLGVNDIGVTQAGDRVPARVARLTGADLDVAVVVDLAGSADDVKAVRGAADELIRTLPGGSRVAVVVPGEPPVLAAPLGADKTRPLAALSRLVGARRGEAGPAVALGVRQTSAGPGTGTRDVVVWLSARPVSDDSGLEAAVRQTGQRVSLYVTGVAADPVATSTGEFAESSGGRAIVVERRGLLIGATDEITSEMGSQYRVAFRVPAPTPDEVTVTMTKAGLTAMTAVALGPSAASPTGAGIPGNVVPEVAPNAAPPPPDESPDPVALAALAVGLLLVALLGLTVVRRVRKRGRSRSYYGGAPAKELVEPFLAAATIPSGGEPWTLRSEAGGPGKNAPGPEQSRNGPNAAAVASRVVDIRDPAPVGRIDDLVVEAARRADAEVAELERRLASRPDELRLDGFFLREAVASLCREGSGVTLGDVFRARSAPGLGVPQPVQEVEQLVAATDWAFDRAAAGHLDKQVLAEVVARRGEGPALARRELADGALRRTDQFPASLKVHSPSLRAALVREIVETMWPVDADRAWLGRAAVTLSLARDVALSNPVIDLSSHLADGGATATTNGTGGALLATIEAIAARARATGARLDRMIALRAQQRNGLDPESSGAATELVELMLFNPILTTQYAAESIGVTEEEAANLIRHAEATDWLRRVVSLSGDGRAYWIAPAVVSVLEDDFATANSSRHTPGGD